MTAANGDPRRAARPGAKNTPKEDMTLVGSVVTALAASACCIGPVVFALLGTGGAAFAIALEPYRPVFIGMTALLLGGAFYFVYRRSPGEQCGPDSTCPAPSRRIDLKVLVWVVSMIVLAVLAFPYYVNYLL